MNSIFDLEYKKGLYIDLHLPESKDFDLLVYFHGGGLTSGSRKGFEVFAKTTYPEACTHLLRILLTDFPYHRL